MFNSFKTPAVTTGLFILALLFPVIGYLCIIWVAYMFVTEALSAYDKAQKAPFNNILRNVRS